MKVLAATGFDHHAATRALCKQFGTATLAGFGCEFAACHRCRRRVARLRRSTRSKVVRSHVTGLGRWSGPATSCSWMRPPGATWNSLETLRGRRAYPLLHAPDATVTSQGKRWLRHALHHPLRDRATLRRRLDAVQTLHGSAGGALRALRNLLRRSGGCGAYYFACCARQCAAARLGEPAHQSAHTAGPA